MRTSKPLEGGFTAIPRGTFDALLCLPLSRREMSVLLLVARLTHGCRNARSARLRPSDLKAAGIGPNHASECLSGLVGRGLLAREGDAYRLDAEAMLREVRDDRERTEALAALVRRQLEEADRRQASQFGAESFPFREQTPSRNGKGQGARGWRFDRSRSGFVRISGPPIDSQRHVKTGECPAE